MSHNAIHQSIISTPMVFKQTEAAKTLQKPLIDGRNISKDVTPNMHTKEITKVFLDSQDELSTQNNAEQFSIVKAAAGSDPFAFFDEDTLMEEAENKLQEGGVVAVQAGTAKKQAGTEAKQIEAVAIQAGTENIQAGTENKQAGTEIIQAGTATTRAGITEVKRTAVESIKTQEVMEVDLAKLREGCDGILVGEGNDTLSDRINDVILAGTKRSENGTAKVTIRENALKEVDQLASEGKLRKRDKDTGELRRLNGVEIQELKEHLGKYLDRYISAHIEQIRQMDNPNQVEGEKVEKSLSSLAAPSHTTQITPITNTPVQKIDKAIDILYKFPLINNLRSCETKLQEYLKLIKLKAEIEDDQAVQKLQGIKKSELKKEILKDEITKNGINDLMSKLEILKHELEEKRSEYGQEYENVFFAVCDLIKEVINNGRVKRIT